MAVNFKGKEKVCFHCHVEGHGKAQCPIQEFKTCYNCGSPLHNYSQCYEETLITYHFNKEKQYKLYCYPRDCLAKDVEYGCVESKEEVFDYHVTFEVIPGLTIR